MAQSFFDDFMVCLPYWMRKTLTVLLMSYFQMRHHGGNVRSSAVEAAFITDFNEKTVWASKNDISQTKENFLTLRRGSMRDFCLFSDEIRLEASM